MASEHEPMAQQTTCALAALGTPPLARRNGDLVAAACACTESPPTGSEHTRARPAAEKPDTRAYMLHSSSPAGSISSSKQGSTEARKTGTRRMTITDAASPTVEHAMTPVIASGTPIGMNMASCRASP